MFGPPKPTMREFVELQEGTEGTSSPLPALDEGEQMLLVTPNVTLAFTTETTVGTGTLAVTSARICWLGTSKCYEFDVPYVCLHAIARDPNTYPKPCLYCQLDEEEELREAFFAPPSEDALQPMFDAFSRAAELNPDEPEPGEQEGDDELIFDEEGIMNAQQAGMLARFDEMLVAPGDGGGAAAESGQFDDAEGWGEEGDEEEGEEGEEQGETGGAANGVQHR